RKRLRIPWSPRWQPLVMDRRVESVRRRGKWIIIGLDDGQVLVMHLGMTGRLTITESDEACAPHTHLVFRLDSSGELRFNDIRRFGSVKLYTTLDDLEQYFEESRLGPEPFDLEPGLWRDRLQGTDRCLKAVLLDQTVVAGVGNIYADESLFEARLHPARSAQ